MPVPPYLRVARVVHLEEAVEDARQVIGGDADPLVGDLDAHLAPAVDGGEADRHTAAAIAELHRVVENRAQHLGEPLRVGDRR